MYESFFGLTERPFDLTTDPRFLHLTAKHREALYTLRYGISGGKGLTMVVGEAGTGKTTLLQKALDDETRENRSIACIRNPTLTRSEFFESLTGGFGLSDAASRSKSRFLVEFEARLLERRQAGGLSALIVDEAQALPQELLEEIRLLANLETATEKLLAVVFVGQPELAIRLNDPALRQLKQRIALRCRLRPLDLQETAAYISARIQTAGGDSPRVFTREAVLAIYEYSGGIPRTISVICDNALITGFAADQRPVGKNEVLEACEDLDLVRTATVSMKPRSQAASSGGAASRSSDTPRESTGRGPGDTRGGGDAPSRQDASTDPGGPSQSPSSRASTPSRPVRTAWRGFSSFSS